MKADSIRVDSGQKKIRINEDPKRVVVFNPSDLLFGKKFYALLGDFDRKNTEFQKRQTELEKSEEVDKFGLPDNLPDSFDLADEMCDYLFEKIDDLFGKGTSKIVFEGHRDMVMFPQFFDGIVPYIEEARTERIERYTKPAKPKPKAKG
jgi:hypothetical protein